MKIALIGYGKMGKEIEKIALSRGHEIVSIIDVNNQEDLNRPHQKCRCRHRIYQSDGSLQQLYESFQGRRKIGFGQYRLAGRTW